MSHFSERQIEDFIQLLENQSDNVYKHYPGCEMYGKTCIGFLTSNVIRDVSDIVSTAHEEVFLFEDDERGEELLDIVQYAFSNASTDSIGYDTVVYFTSIQYPFNEDDNK